MREQKRDELVNMINKEEFPPLMSESVIQKKEEEKNEDVHPLDRVEKKIEDDLQFEEIPSLSYIQRDEVLHSF